LAWINDGHTTKGIGHSSPVRLQCEDALSVELARFLLRLPFLMGQGSLHGQIYEVNLGRFPSQIQTKDWKW
jgi:hypothetical protein